MQSVAYPSAHVPRDAGSLFGQRCTILDIVGECREQPFGLVVAEPGHQDRRQRCGGAQFQYVAAAADYAARGLHLGDQICHKRKRAHRSALHPPVSPF